MRGDRRLGHQCEFAPVCLWGCAVMLGLIALTVFRHTVSTLAAALMFGHLLPGSFSRHLLIAATTLFGASGLAS